MATSSPALRPFGVVCSISIAVLLLVRFRSRKAVRIRTRSKRALERLQTASTALGYHVEVLSEEEQPGDCADITWTSSRKTAFVPTRSWNRLCGSRCLEDKRLLGELLNSGETGCDHLESYSINNKQEFEIWWNHPNAIRKRLWVLKDACANGGCGLWFIDRTEPEDFDLACEVLSMKNEAGFTVQEYLPGRPLLWNGRKFHFRVAGVVTATGRAFLHRTAFVHPANKDYDPDPGLLKDPAVHITNLCVNLALDDPSRFVGEVREDLIRDRPNLWPKMLELWGSVVAVCFKVMRFQRSKLDFEYVGLDMIANESGQVFLIEANCPPAMSSATGYAHAETMHDEILFDLFRYMVLPPVFQVHAEKLKSNSTGGFFECPTGVKAEDLHFTDDYRKAQASCDLSLMMFRKKLRNPS